MKIESSTAALLLTATMALTMAVAAPHSAAQTDARNAARVSTASNSAQSNSAQSNSQQGAAKKAPQAKSKAEFDAYQSAVAQTEAAKLEASATDFAQRFPASALRPFLFQRAMGLYQQANNSGKTLEMARAALKYDPANPVALLGAAQILADVTHEDDLDRDARLEEAGADAQAALQHAGELAPPAGLTAEQFESVIVELRGAAHEVLGTVAYKKHDYRNAIEEYNAAVAGEKQPIGPAVWLRLAAAHGKAGEYSLGIAAVEKAIAASEPGSPVRELAEKENARLRLLASEAATSSVQTRPVQTRPVETGAAEKSAETSRSSAAGE